MPFDLRTAIASERGRNYELYAEHVNPQFAKVMRTIGFDRTYVRAAGQYLWDSEGHRVLDFLGGYAVCNVGRNHPTVRKALEDVLALDVASMVQFDAPLLAGMLAADLKRRIGRGLDYVYFANSGTEGVEAAIKFAKCSTGKPAVLYCDKAFHGLTAGAVSLNGCESFRDGFGPFLPQCRRIPFDDLNALERELRNGDVAAFVVEPIQGKGVNIPTRGYLAQAGRLCRRFGARFVVDEVQTGVGRTGRFLAIDHETDVDPDVVVLSKALSGGYVPVGAVLVKGDVWRDVYSSMDRAIVHSSTFHEGALAMAAALASLAVYDDDRLDENATRLGERIRLGVEAMIPRFEFLKSVRQRGLMIGIEFAEPKSLLLRTAWKMVHAMDDNLFAQAVVMPLMEDHAILCQVAGHNQAIVKLTPPLCITDDDVAAFLNAFEEVMRRLHRFPGPAWDVLKRLGVNALTHRTRSADAEPAASPAP
ncbi:MAG: aspartate aminotransferase family protein [Phycisphaerales bacterium]